MQISLDTGTGSIIQAYSNHQIKINGKVYSTNCLITPTGLEPEWTKQSLSSLSIDDFKPWLSPEIEFVLIGHDAPGCKLPYSLIQVLSSQRIGFECMDIGAACRTYTVLNSENRQFIAGFLFR